MRPVGLASVALCGLAAACASPQPPYMTSYPTYTPAPSLSASDIILPSHSAASRTDPVRELSDAIQPQRLAYYKCVRLAALEYIEAAENAATITDAAITRCYKEESELQRAVVVHNRTGISDYKILDIHRESARSNLVEMIIRIREAARQADRHKSNWSECVVTFATVHAAKGAKEAISEAFAACAASENGMKAAWTAMIDDAFASEKVAAMKRRAVPILAKYIDDINRSGSQAVKKPDMTI